MSIDVLFERSAAFPMLCAILIRELKFGITPIP